MKKILMIDDDAELCREMAELLAGEGYAVAVETDGRRGLARLGRGGYALVILDLKLPGMGGLELLGRMRRGGDATPVVVLSGGPLVAGGGISASPADRRALRLADAALPKPFDVDRLLRTIRRILG